MISDALPGVGIVAAGLGIINTMSNLEDPESVGYKVAAALVVLSQGSSWHRFRCLGKVGFLNQTQESLLQKLKMFWFRYWTFPNYGS